MYTKKGNIIIISAASGTGKTSLINELIKLDSKIRLSISYTSRKKRVNEIDGEHYFFINEEDFKRKISANFFLEYAQVYNNYYGTSEEEVFSNINLGYDIILEIDVQGAFDVMKKLNKDYFCTAIFILPPSLNELDNRLSNRDTDSRSNINLRMNNALSEIGCAFNFDYIIINDKFNQAVNDLYHIICSLRLDIRNNRLIINNILKGKGI